MITESVSPLSVQHTKPGSFLSYHMCVVSTLSIDKPLIESKECTYRKIKDLNRYEFSLELQRWLSDFEVENLEEMIKSFNDTITSVLDEFTPERNKKILQRQKNPWFSDRIKEQKRLVRNNEK